MRSIPSDATLPSGEAPGAVVIPAAEGELEL